MGNKRGNPAWVKGKSGNPEGRPKGQTSLEAFSRDPDRFFFRHYRWWRFVHGLMEPPYTGAAAARRAGYSLAYLAFLDSVNVTQDTGQPVKQCPCLADAHKPPLHKTLKSAMR